jgi:hypothetical protein
MDATQNTILNEIANAVGVTPTHVKGIVAEISGN